MENKQMQISPEKYYLEAKQKFQNQILFQKGFNKKQRAYFLFPLLERNGIDTWKKLSQEQKLIDDKKSQFSREVRDAVNHLHTHCLLQCAEEFKNHLND